MRAKAAEFDILCDSNYTEMQGVDDKDPTTDEEDMKTLWDVCGDHLIQKVVHYYG